MGGLGSEVSRDVALLDQVGLRVVLAEPLVLSVDVGPPGTALALATSYGRSNWPLVTLYADNGLPVLPWCITLGLAVNVPCYSAGV